MTLLNKAQILEANDIHTQIVSVPEWGGHVKITGISARVRDQWEVTIAEQREKKKPVDVRASLCAKAIIDEDGRKLFTDDDIKALGNKSAAALQRVFLAAMSLSGLDDKAVEELEGNSKADL